MSDNIFPTKPKTSFVIRTFNEEKWLPVLLDSLFSQSRLDFEIILVDSGSTDNTLKILQKYPIRKIIKIRKKDFNYAYALNIGISESWGEIIGIVSGHSIPISRSWYSDGMIHFNDIKVAGVSGYFTPLPDASYREKLLSLHEGDQYIRYESCSRWMTNTNALIRKDLWLQYPFDEQITRGDPAYDFATEGCEDYDWASEMIARRFRVVKDPKFNVYHSHGGIGRLAYSERIERWNQICSMIDKKKRPSDSRNANSLTSLFRPVLEFFKKQRGDS